MSASAVMPIFLKGSFRHAFSASASCEREQAEKADDARWLHSSDKKPDIDNATKLILDSLNGVVAWKDDNQVCFQCAMKIYSEQPCVRVIIEGKSRGRGIL